MKAGGQAAAGWTGRIHATGVADCSGNRGVLSRLRGDVRSPRAPGGDNELMRRLIVQMQMSVDGFVASDPPDLNWTVWGWGPDCGWDYVLQADSNTLYVSVDTVLLSRVMIEEGFLDHWTAAANYHPGNALYAFARRIVEI